MRRGDFATAWAISDAVLATRDPADRDNPTLPYHLRWVWDATPLADRHVLVRCYHGLGDTLQFARYLPVLRPLVTSLSVEAPAELLPLLVDVPGPDRLIPFVHNAPAPPGACDIEIMELAHALRLPPDKAPSPPYFRPLPGSVPPGTIGLCWQAGGWDGERSMTADEMAPLTAWPCVTLQPQPTSLRVLNQTGCPPEVAATAALIAALDLVITVDTMVAHLAGSLNVPTWLLLKHEADWRWMATRPDSPWYPSMRLYRQPDPGNWAPVIAQVVIDLRARR